MGRLALSGRVFLVALLLALRVLPPWSARASLPLLDRSLAPEHRHAHVLGLCARLAHARLRLTGETVGSVGSVYGSTRLARFCCAAAEEALVVRSVGSQRARLVAVPRVARTHRQVDQLVQFTSRAHLRVHASARSRERFQLLPQVKRGRHEVLVLLHHRVNSLMPMLPSPSASMSRMMESMPLAKPPTPPKLEKPRPTRSSVLNFSPPLRCSPPRM